MRKEKILSLLISLGLVFVLLHSFYSFAEERITLTTYYPAPYGVYKELRVDQMAIGSGYRSATLSDGLLLVNGSVGIGTTGPMAKLHIADTNTDTTIWSRQGTLLLRNTVNTNGVWAGIQNDGSSGSINSGIAFVTTNQASNYGRIDFATRGPAGWNGAAMSIYNGNVGIGTTGGSQKLNFGGRQLIGFNQNTTSETTQNIIGGLGFYGYGVSHGQFHYRAGKGFEMLDVSADGPSITHNSTVFAPLYLGSLYTTGNVGINTNSTTATLDVRGTSNICVRVNYDTSPAITNCPSNYYIALGSAAGPAPSSGYFICCRSCIDVTGGSGSTPGDGICD